MNETQRLNDIIKKQSTINGLVDLTHELLDLFPEWNEVPHEPTCLNNYSISHKYYDKNFDIDSEHKYLCVDSRDCKYKSDYENRQYCKLPLGDKHE